MAWPFSNVVQPNFDTGAGTAVPAVAGSLTTSVTWILGAHLTNTGSVQRTITITNTAGTVLLAITLAAGSDQPYEWAFRPTTGIKWSADGVGVIGHVWGYQ